MTEMRRLIGFDSVGAGGGARGPRAGGALGAGGGMRPAPLGIGGGMGTFDGFCTPDVVGAWVC